MVALHRGCGQRIHKPSGTPRLGRLIIAIGEPRTPPPRTGSSGAGRGAALHRPPFTPLVWRREPVEELGPSGIAVIISTQAAGGVKMEWGGKWRKFQGVWNKFGGLGVGVIQFLALENRSNRQAEAGQ